MSAIPLDPADLYRLPPDDLTDCPRCDGSGLIFAGFDTQTNKPIDADCAACDGTGERTPL